MKDKHKTHWTEFYQGEQIKYVGKISVKDAPITDEMGKMEMPEGKFEVYGAGTDYIDIPQFIFQIKPFRLRLFGKDII